MSAETVYINDCPIGETEVYHAQKGHVTTLRRLSDRYVRETTAREVQEEGYRPCKQCFPEYVIRSCPGCGHEGVGAEVLADGQKWCPNTDCRVVSFNPPEGGRNVRAKNTDSDRSGGQR